MMRKIYPRPIVDKKPDNLNTQKSKNRPISGREENYK